jgi:hypothetical protein
MGIGGAGEGFGPPVIRTGFRSGWESQDSKKPKRIRIPARDLIIAADVEYGVRDGDQY